MAELEYVPLPPQLSSRLGVLYADMETAYDAVARQLGFSCTGCPDNCCDSFFLHYTYMEWAYLWEGLQILSIERRQTIRARARAYVAEAEKLLARGARPQLVCPLNEAGLCSLYSHRLMICRMHGVPSSFTQPDGRRVDFPGCPQCQELVTQKNVNGLGVDRTALYEQLVQLERTLLSIRKGILPRIRMTIAQMIMAGPPDL